MHCKLLRAWATNFPSLLTYGIPKRSPYGPFLYHHQLKLIENGALRALLNRWNEDEPVCNDSRVDSLGFEKIIMTFMIVGLGIVCSVSTFIVEFVTAQLVPSRKGKNEMHDLFTGNLHKTRGKKNMDMNLGATSKRLEKWLRKHIVANKVNEDRYDKELVLQMEMLLCQLQSASFKRHSK